MRVRLSDIDPKVRQAAARRLMRHETDPAKLLDLALAATAPSNRWYIVSDEAESMMPFITSGHGDTISAAPK